MEEDGRSEHPSAEDHAAEAMAADMDPWIVFDARKTPRAEFPGWLESHRPSRVSRFGDGEDGQGPVGWICVRGPHFSEGAGDVDGLQDSWERLRDSGRGVSAQAIRQLALDHGVLDGKWLMHLDTGFKVDHAWEGIARATLEGHIDSAKVSPRGPSDSRHVICAYNRDFTDLAQVVRLEQAIRAAGLKCPLVYKPDVYTHLGIYRSNRWSLCPGIYESAFALEDQPRSHVLDRLSGREVS